jgi:NDP-sugar pyrophosphorylase family protein
VQCLILAGGLATRMRPLTETIPKAMIPVEGRPFIDHQLAWLAAHGVTDVVLSVGYLGEAIQAHVGDGARYGLRARVVDEGPNLRGTAGAVRLAFDEGVLDERFLLTYGDSFLPIDFAAVFRHFEASGAPALMTVYRNQGRWDTSNVIFDGRMVTLYDKQRRTRPPEDFAFIDYGLSALTRKAVEQGIATGQKADLADLFHGLSLRGELCGWESPERFYEIGSPAGLTDFSEWVRARG